MVSVTALAADVTIFLTLAGAVLTPSVAGAAGYATGLLIHYTLSVRYVFDTTATGKGETRLIAEFVASGLLGLTMTTLVITAATVGLGLSALPAKLAAIVASFVVVYTLRRCIVFAAPRAAAPAVSASHPSR